MLIDTLKSLFKRDLNKLKQEIEQYNQEDSMWLVEKTIENSAGNLCLHLIGNLNTYIGAELGASGYIRNRDLEFSATHIPRAVLVEQIIETASIVDKILDNITEEQLKADATLQIFEKVVSTEYFLIHLSTHLAYHLGQINYHRRLLDK
jgi:hypothetical protein